MKKYKCYLAFLAMIAVFAILASCGEGEIVDLSDGSSDIDKANINLIGQGESPGFIDDCFKEANKGKDECAPLYRSSNSVEPSSSSDFESSSGSGESSSGGEQSSSGGQSSSTGQSSSGGQSSSAAQSSSAGQSSSSSVDPNAYSVSSFTCAWDKAEIVTGKTGSVNITLNPADDVEGVTCSKEVWLPVLTLAGAEYERYVFTFPKLVKFGETIYPAPSPSLRAIKFPDEPSGNSASFTVKGRVSCSGGGKPTGTRDQDCTALTISKAPTARVTGTLAFSNARTVPGVTGNAFFGGDTPEYNQYLAFEDEDAEYVEYCGEIEYVKSWTGTTVTAGAAVTNITVTAKCSLSGQPVFPAQTAAASVVPNPSLSGSCTWDTKNNTFGGGVSARVTAAPTILNPYGRTCIGPYFSVNGDQRENVSAGLTVDAWNQTTEQTMTGITIGATCAGNAVTPTITCSNITVKDPDAMCEYLTSWCDGITLANIKTANVTSDPGIGSDGGSKCFFATTIEKIGNTSNVTVNGTSIGNDGKCGNTGWGQPTCAAALTTAEVESADGGYYVFVPSAGNWTAQDLRLTNSHAPLLHPNCEAQK